MNRYKLSISGINPNDGIKRFGNNPDKYEACLKEFINDNHYNELCEAILKEDVAAAFTAAHALKGVAGNLSLAKLFKDISPLVEELRGKSLEHSAELLKPVSCDYEKIMAVLRDM